MGNQASIAATLRPPYYAVIFTSIRSRQQEGYAEMAMRMAQLAAQQPGFLGIESVSEGDLGITVSYWESEQALIDWKRNLEHRDAQTRGREQWYRHFKVRVARVERDYGFGSA